MLLRPKLLNGKLGLVPTYSLILSNNENVPVSARSCSTSQSETSRSEARIDAPMVFGHFRFSIGFREAAEGQYRYPSLELTVALLSAVTDTLSARRLCNRYLPEALRVKLGPSGSTRPSALGRSNLMNSADGHGRHHPESLFIQAQYGAQANAYLSSALIRK